MMGWPGYAIPRDLVDCIGHPWTAYDLRWELLVPSPRGGYASIPMARDIPADAIGQAYFGYCVIAGPVAVFLSVHERSDLAVEARLLASMSIDPPGFVEGGEAASQAWGRRTYWTAGAKLADLLGRSLLASGGRPFGGSRACRSIYRADESVMEKALAGLVCQKYMPVWHEGDRSAESLHQARLALDERAHVVGRGLAVCVYQGAGVDAEEHNLVPYVALGLRRASPNIRLGRGGRWLMDLCEAALADAGARPFGHVKPWRAHAVE